MTFIPDEFTRADWETAAREGVSHQDVPRLPMTTDERCERLLELVESLTERIVELEAQVQSH